MPERAEDKNAFAERLLLDGRYADAAVIFRDLGRIDDACLAVAEGFMHARRFGASPTEWETLERLNIELPRDIAGRAPAGDTPNEDDQR